MCCKAMKDSKKKRKGQISKELAQLNPIFLHFYLLLLLFRYLHLHLHAHLTSLGIYQDKGH